MPSHAFIPFNENGFSHPKCYLGCTNGCSEKISGEHYFSESLLHQIERTNKTIDLAGVKWLPPEHWKSVGKSALTAKILCKRHNELLSPLDTEIAHLSRHIADIDGEFLKPNPTSLHFRINGALLERWALKTMIGLVESRQVASKNGIEYSYKNECIRLLCDPNYDWPLNWGLYFASSTEPVYFSRSFEFRLRSNDATGLVLGADLVFNGITTTLILGRPGNPSAFGQFRPTSVVLRKDKSLSTISLDWERLNPGPPFTLFHKGTYHGLAPGHDLPRAD